MLRSYFLVAVRSLRRHAGFTILNILGLAAGLACAILIGLWVDDELSYDDFHPKAERTYRVLNTFDMPQVKATLAHGPATLAPTLASGYTRVENVVRLNAREMTVAVDDREVIQPDILFADHDFFEVFGMSVTRGSARLDAPRTVLLTPGAVKAYFPDDPDPIGQTIRIDGTPVEVTGVVEAAPKNTHLDYEMIVSTTTLSLPENSWGYNDWVTYVTLQPGISEADFERTLREVSIEHLPTLAALEAPTADDDLPQYFHLQPLTGIHLGVGAPALETGGGTGNVTYVYLFVALAVFVLLLACINFMNLSTARSSERANEVGVRKSMGAGRSQLAGQFLGESLLTSAVALAVALGLCSLVLPLFGDLAGKSLPMSALFAPSHVVVYVGMVLIVGLVAGAYPAIVLSNYEPVETLRGHAKSSHGSSMLRKALVVFQFSISIALIAGTATVHRQVAFLQSKGLGFDEENVMIVEQARGLAGPMRTPADNDAFQRRLDSFQREIDQLVGVETATASYSLPGTFFFNSLFPLDAPEAEGRNLDYSFVGYDYVETLDLSMAAGRDFSRDVATDTAAVMINEAGARRYGFSPADAVGESIRYGDRSVEIVGVVEDFHYESLHTDIYPLLLFHRSIRAPQYIAVRVAAGDEAATVNAVRQTWQSFSDHPFEYSFLADDLAAQYESEARLGRLFLGFAGLSILIASLGLFGLAAYATRQRTREVGIRKALGASGRSIVALLSRDFLLLVGLAFLLAAPVAYLGMDRWLQTFAYRTDVGIVLLGFAGGLAMLIAILTVSTQAWRAARTNPATALRME